MALNDSGLPRTMRAAVLTGFGGYEKLQVRPDVPVPAPADDEVLVKVAACGVNNTDIWTREGAYGTGTQSGWREGAFEFPRIQGADIVGRIAAVGARIPRERLGARVMVNPALYAGDGDGLFDAAYIGSERDGGFAEFACVPDANAHAIDSALSDPELATFMTAYLTAEHMLNRAAVAAGETVLVTGASGGVGSALVQLARLRGARVAAVVGKGKEGPLEELGAEAVLFRGETDFRRAIESRLGSGIVDVVADIVGGEQSARLLDLIRTGGRYVTAGAIAGPMATIDWRTIYLKHLTVLGSTMGTQSEARQIVVHVAAGRLRPLLAGAYPLDRLVQAQTDFKAKTHFGKLVVVP
ncbi:MAG: alcohol dehydrogenase family protein [Desulfobacterales bacterium]|jgi:NADPH:quinone reductase-like Zn-dependent oxidoreductase|nr:alcohol dehydrogenase family protein [Desulfobacterales bacterium]